jgi:hypothetical protein
MLSDMALNLKEREHHENAKWLVVVSIDKRLGS